MPGSANHALEDMILVDGAFNADYEDVANPAASGVQFAAVTAGINCAGSCHSPGLNVVDVTKDITALARSTGLANVTAKADGIEQHTAGSGNSANYIANDHWLVDASAHALGSVHSSAGHAITGSDAALSASARAYGLYQDVDPIHGSNFVYNSGTIEAYASASHAIDVYAEAKAVDQLASGSDALNQVTNDGGLILGDAHAYGASFTTATKATARAYGVDQHAEGYFAANDIYNAASIIALASAYDAGNVSAEAKAINQYADALTGAENYLANSGLVMASAKAHDGHGFLTQTHTVHEVTIGYSGIYSSIPIQSAVTSEFNHWHEGHVTAKAYGVDQHAAGYLATNAIYNAASIIALASAYDGSHVLAEAKGVNQVVEGMDLYAGENLVDNHGLIAASAHAYAAFSHYSAVNNSYVGGSATAKAYGVDQHIADVYSGHNIVENYGATHSGKFTAGAIMAKAVASNSYNAYAEAKAVNQHVEGIDASNSVYNAGLIAASALAHGLPLSHSGVTHFYSATSATAKARGVDQHASGYHAVNAVSNDGVIAAEASAFSAVRFAIADAKGVEQEGLGTGGLSEEVLNGIDNSGLIMAVAKAYHAGLEASAYAVGASQLAQGTLAFNAVDNYGTIIGVAQASHAEFVFAKARGIEQHAQGSAIHTAVSNSVANSGAVGASAIARDAFEASADAKGIDQRIAGYDAQDIVSNHGLIDAIASASNATFAYAHASGVEQRNAAYSGVNRVTNFASAQIEATAKAHGFYVSANNYSFDNHASAFAFGIYQTLGVDHGTNSVHNQGMIEALAEASVAYLGVAEAVGVSQYAAAYDGENFVSNEDIIDAKASASAEYFAKAYATDVFQMADAYAAQNYVFNSGLIAASAHASAFGGSLGDPLAAAQAIGIHEDFYAHVADVTDINKGTIDAKAYALVDGGSAQEAIALAAGIFVGETEAMSHYTGAPVAGATSLNVDIVNRGAIHAFASAAVTSAHGIGNALAYGIAVVNPDTGLGQGLVNGVIENHGFIGAEAYAPFNMAGDHATAIGVGVRAEEFKGTIVNSATIDAQAFAHTANAIGIGVEENGAYAPTADHAIGHIVNNGGLIFASTNDGGEASAINVAHAPNEIDIALEGTQQMGQIFGAIEDAEPSANWTNKITVEDGVTYLDGAINPGLATLGNGGTLTIASNGTLWLANASTSFWGLNPILNVASYNQVGTLKLDLDASGNSATINAVNVNLSGALVVNPNPYTLFGNSTTFDVINSQTAISGGWSSIATTSVSPFLIFSDTVSGDEATVTEARLAFNAFPGLTRNEDAVAGALEGGYKTSLTGGAKAFYLSLFQLTAAQYPGALNMLSDSQAGEVAQANVVSVNAFDDRINDRMAQMNALARPGGQLGNHSLDEAGSITLWGAPYSTWTNTASTASGPGYTDNRSGLMIGADTVLGTSRVLVGIAGNIESKGSMRFEDGSWNSLTPGGYGTSKGWDIAGYARFNAPNVDHDFYLQGSFSYGTYDDTTQRIVTLPVLPTLSSVRGEPSPARALLPPYTPSAQWFSGLESASFNSDVWSAYGEAGVPINLRMSNLAFTPYAGLRYVHSGSGAFSETETGPLVAAGVTAPALNVSGADGNSLSSYLGAEFSTRAQLGGNQILVPTLRAAWVHNFMDPWKVDASFSGLSGGAFASDGSTWSRDSGLIDFALSMAFMGNMAASLGYNADLGGTQTVQTVYGRIDITFGGEEAPPPPPKTAQKTAAHEPELHCGAFGCDWY